MGKLYFVNKKTKSIKMAVLGSVKNEYTLFSKLVYEVLKEYSGCILAMETVDGLLRKENERKPSETLKNEQIPQCKITSGINSYPAYPLYTKISRILYDWLKNGKCDTRTPELLEECRNKTEKQMSRDFVDQKLKEYLLSDEICTRKGLILEILENLKLRGILDLLGMKQTVGSVDILPPSLSTIWESFTRKHKQNAELSCGARALSKHCHRDSTSQWWGTSTGSEGNKNEHANQVLDKILADAVWINIHLLPHDVKILEVRNQLGYGARWSYDGMIFRGFLEPQMSDGHSVGWRH
ncbi:Hypothetical predicted protein [Paramuricea clavata]|uniref:Uncharacterized protein n=1 Tax=Paramuricea clavata TaxID=317549 RepID=A0A7D9HI87_PARCT|nr:Hypothetical predicted protein [Paramuricea clavata]